MLLSLFAFLLVAVVVVVEQFDSSELLQASVLIDNITQLDTATEQKMASIFIHDQGRWQPLQSLAAALDASQKKIDVVVRAEVGERLEWLFVDTGNVVALQENAQALQDSIAIQLHAIADFSTNMPKLTRAQRAFFVQVSASAVQHPDLSQQINLLASELVQWQLFPDDLLKQKVTRQLGQMDAVVLASLIGSAHAILNYREVVMDALNTAKNCGTPENLSLLRKQFEAHYANEASFYAMSKQVLEAMVALLLLYLSLLLVGVNKRNERLKQALNEKELLQERNRLLLAAMELAPNGILVCNHDGQVLYANRRLATLHNEEDSQVLIGRYAAELRGGERNDAFYHEIVTAIDDGRAWNGEYTLSADGEKPTIIARMMSGITLDGYGYMVGIDRDVTEEREQAAKLESVQRLESLGILAGGIAHDFNNILTAIRGNAMLAQRNCQPENARYLQRIQEGTARAADLCQQMLAYAGKETLVIEPLNLSTLVDDVSKLIAISIDARIRVSIDLAETLPPVEGDHTQIQQIILNLITNANEAITGQPSWTDGAIAISTSLCEVDDTVFSDALCGSDLQAGVFVALDVTDNGCGMNEATIQRIFEPFFTTKFTGRGLGMSAILGIVQSHHGALLLDSEPNQGSHFRLLLPPTEKPLVEPVPSATVEPSATLSGLVLIVDDEEVIREMATEVLEEIGLRTIMAENGQEGVELFRQHQSAIAVVLLDMTMPIMDGERCFHALRAIREDIPVVVASGYAEQDVFQVFGENNLAGFLHKPFNIETLQQTMQKIVTASQRD
ncbi:MAG: response regulator [Mariprofundales bacterium]